MPKRLNNWVPKQDRAFLTCKGCGEDKPPSGFSTHGKTKSGYLAYHSRCKECYWGHAKTLPSYEEKRLLVEQAKTSCSVCGYDRCKDAMDFHHTDRANKLFGIAAGVKSSTITRQELEDEISKCVILCSNCHRELHAAERSLDDKLVG